ncbi:hypothetical protein KC929_01070 [Patescibacteria group bacterium]|nr:hypothetical protein [Patescibacteria group bacterium]
MKRIFLIAILFFAFLWLAPWFVLALATMFAFATPGRYYEILVVSFLLDVVYQPLIIITSWLSVPPYTLLGVVLFVMVTLVKKRMNWYA